MADDFNPVDTPHPFHEAAVPPENDDLTAKALQEIEGFDENGLEILNNDLLLVGQNEDSIAAFINDLLRRLVVLERTPGALKLAELALTNNDLNNLNVTPMTLVAAPGAGYLIVPVQYYHSVRKTVVSGGPSCSLRTRYNGAAQDVTTAVACDLANNRHYAQGAFNTNSAFVSTTYANLANKALELSATAAGPFGASDAIVDVSLVYYLARTVYP